MSINNESNWIPEIVYEDDANGMTSKIPFIMVPSNQEMPKFLFVFESRETGEFEPGLDGEELPIVEMDLHQYADMAVLKNKLSPVDFDKVRASLGLEPLLKASASGAKITNKIRKNLEN